MKFGLVALDQAHGAVLAHSVALRKGRLRKGHTLAADDILRLAEVGVEKVTVARLDPSDVDENTAAAALAKAVGGQAEGLNISNAFTGRSNLVAPGPGIVTLDVAALEAVNLIHPMITIATVPAHQQMTQGGLVATIKIISYGVPKTDLNAACRAGTGAIGFEGPKLATATLIISQIEGGAGDKGQSAIEGRLQALGVALSEVRAVAHTQQALSEAIQTAQGELVLILTGSATSDIEDVAPSALRDAGGRIERFGMPVDPGNLLFLGDINGRPVIGLPGCARSPALNGADWVLARVVCGIPVRSADIAAMGVGGLLKEIPTRPQPRQKR